MLIVAHLYTPYNLLYAWRLSRWSLGMSQVQSAADMEEQDRRGVAKFLKLVKMLIANEDTFTTQPIMVQAVKGG
jgi:hypothetical protein